MNCRPFAAAGFLIMACSAWSQSYINAEFRPRIILDAGYKKPRATGETPFAYVTQRTRLNAGWGDGPLEACISLQDVRFWGGDNIYSRNGTSGNTESLSLHQAWFRLEPANTVSITAGRQLFSYDDQRILASRSWNDCQVTYDAVLFRFDDTTSRMDIALSWNAESPNSTHYPDEKFRLFDFVRYERRFDPFGVSFTGLLTGNTVSDTSQAVYLRGTWGLNVNYADQGLSLRASVYYQHHLNLHGNRVSAYCASVFIRQSLFRNKASAGLGYDCLSGQDEMNTKADYQNTDHAFDILYGRRHAWYGYMDYFSTLPEQGLQDLMVKTVYRPGTNLSLQADYHHFMLAAGMSDPESPGTGMNGNLGHEFDLVLDWSPLKGVNLQAGYSFYLTTKTIEEIKGVRGRFIRFPQFAYLMVTVKPGTILHP